MLTLLRFSNAQLLPRSERVHSRVLCLSVGASVAAQIRNKGGIPCAQLNLSVTDVVVEQNRNDHLNAVLSFCLRRTQVRLESLEDCRVLEDPDDDSMSDTHGCPAYVSPEILSGSTPYSGKMADMWSLGVMLYTMLVGRYPFHDPDPATLFSKIRRGQCCLPEGLSPKAKCLLHSLLRKEPSERLTAAELLAHPWFHRPSSSQEAVLGEREASATEQTVPSFDVQEDEDLFC